MNYKALVADDEHIIRKGIVKFLKKYEYINVVAEAENGEEALDIARGMVLDVLFVDINMPILNGLQFIEQLNKIQPEAVVVIISGYDDFEYARQALRLGVSEYISKPLMEETFDRAVERVVSKLVEKNNSDKYKNWAEDIVKKNKRYLITEFMYGWFEGHLEAEEIPQKVKQLSLELSDEFMMTMFVLELSNDSEDKETWDEPLINYVVENISMELYEIYKPVCVQARKNLGLIMITQQLPLIELEKLNKKCCDLLEDFLPVKVSVLQEKGSYIKAIPETYHRLNAMADELKSFPNLIKEAKQFIEAHYGKEELSLLDAAEYINVSPQHLSRMFKKEVGITFVDYLTRIRIKKATELLARREMKIYEVAEKVGYSTQHYFSSVFKKVLGVSPVEYRKNL